MKALLYLLSTILSPAKATLSKALRAASNGAIILPCILAATEPQLPERPRPPTNPAATVVSIRWFEYSEAQAALITHLRTELAAAQAALTAPRTEAVAISDTHTWGGQPDTPQGTAPRLLAKSQGGKAYERVIYLQFRMQCLEAAPRKVQLWPHPDTAAGTLTLWPVADDTWSEATLTWNNQPARGAAPLATISLAAGATAPLLIESEALTAYLAAEYAGDRTASLAITGQGEGDGVIRLYSYEAQEPITPAN